MMVRQKRYTILFSGTIITLLGLILFAVNIALAQDTKPVIVISQVDDQAYPQVTARVTVLDESGLALDNLDAADFSVWEDNQAVSGLSVVPVPPEQAEPISLVLALDVSGSMEEADQNGILKIEAAKAEAKSLLASLGPNDQAAIISFSEAIRVEQPFTTDRAALQTAIDGLQLAGDTALNNALFEAAELAGSLPPGKKAIILLTDGLNTAGDLTLDDALDRTRQSGTPVYTVGFLTAGLDPGLRNEAEAALTRIATVTNGHYFLTPTAQDLDLAFQTLAALLRFQYELRFESTLVANCQPHELKVRVSYQGQDGDDFDTLHACPADIPILNLAGPEDTETVSKTIIFTPSIAPPVEIRTAEFQIDGTPMATLTSSPFSFEWDTTHLAPGFHTLKVEVTDSIGQVHFAERMVNVVPPLTLAILEPADHDEVSGQIEAAVEIEGPGQIAMVEFFWNDELLGVVSEPPYTYPIETSHYLDGQYTLRVRAHEMDGYQTEETIEVSVQAVTTNPGTWIAAILGVMILALVVPLGLRARRRWTETAVTAPNGVDAAALTMAPTPAAWLEVVQGTQGDRRYALAAPETSLGRSRSENHIHTEGRTASRRQGLIKISDGQYVYFDLNPTNPTIINGQEIAGSHDLYEGDRIEIGEIILKFTFKER